jgi:hypothetical protein
MVAVAHRPVVTEADLALAGAAIRHRQQVAESLPEGWRGWLAEIFSGYVDPPFARYHEEYWEWLWSIEADQSRRPFVAIWPRGFGKSTAVEVGCAMLAAKQTRRYVLYVCDTQYQADTHVQNVAGLLEARPFVARFPTAARRRVGKYGSSAGWRRNRLRTASGFTIDAIGLDTAARGAKVDKDRPDLIVFDDLDDVLDSPGEVKKKITLVTKSLLPARADHAAVLVAQNLVHEDGVVARLADGRADFLTDRIVSGPHPAIEGIVTEQIDGKAVITAGTSTWPAKTIADLQGDLDDVGLTAFLAEKQHEVGNLEGGIFGHVTFRHCAKAEIPPLEDVQVWVDPAVTDTDKSDAHGIQADGISREGTLYRLFSWEARTSPEDALRRGILKARELKATCIGVETNQGGDTWYSTYELTWRKLVEAEVIPANDPMIEFRQAKAAGTESKRWRASRMLAAYERGEIIHVISGTHETLERALRRYLLRKPFDLVDAAYWGWFGLTVGIDVPEVVVYDDPVTISSI